VCVLFFASIGLPNQRVCCVVFDARLCLAMQSLSEGVNYPTLDLRFRFSLVAFLFTHGGQLLQKRQRANLVFTSVFAIKTW